MSLIWIKLGRSADDQRFNAGYLCCSAIHYLVNKKF